MILRLQRIAKKDKYTIGRLFVNGIRFCDTIEDKDRGLSQDMNEADIVSLKVYGETAIPTGKYKVIKRYSPRLSGRAYGKRYQGNFPALLDVKGFSGILIHPMNTAEESLGCIGPGRNTVVGKVTESTATYYKLMDEHLMPAWKRGEEVTIEIL